MQTFIADGRVSDIPQDAVGKTSNGNVSFKFDFVCDSSLLDENRKPTPSFFHVQMYGKQAEVMAKSLSKGSPILLKEKLSSGAIPVKAVSAALISILLLHSLTGSPS